MKGDSDPQVIEGWVNPDGSHSGDWVRSPPDPLGPARGVLFGCAFSLGLWVVLALLVLR